VTKPILVRSITSRQCIIAIGLGLVWLVIAIVFALALFEKHPTEIIYEDDDSSLSIRSEQRVALLFWQCVTYSWDAENLALYNRPPLPNIADPLAAQGTRQACNIDEAAIFVGTESGPKVEFYPQILWISPTTLLFIGLAATALAVWLWQPLWINTEGSKPKFSYVTFLSMVLLGVLCLKVVNFTPNEYLLIESFKVSLFLSIVGFFAFLMFRQNYKTLFKVACLSVVIVVSLAHLYAFLNIPGAIQYDEKYYASMAATQATGLGLYPYLQNYPTMPIMGGIGYSVTLYTIAYQLLGPRIESIRLIVWVISLLGFPAIFLLFKRWYGSATGWLAIALIPTTYLYSFTYSIRLDLFTITWLWWALLFVDIARKNNSWRWHLFVGLFLGLGLQVHIDTSVATLACGLLYLVDYIRQMRAAERWVWPRAMTICGLGVVGGLVIYILFNILPNGDAFFRTVGNAGRLTTASMSIANDAPMVQRVAMSFLSVGKLANNFFLRIVTLLVEVPATDLMLWLLAFYALLMRRFKADRDALILIIGAVIAAFFILNNYSLYYTTHLLPILYLCLPAAFTHGVSRRSPALVQVSDVSLQLVYFLLTIFFPLCLAIGIAWPPIFNISSNDIILELAQDQITFIQNHVSPDCKILGPAEVYVRAFLRYPRYSSFSYEIVFGLAYYETDDLQRLFFLNDPDIIFEIQGTNLTFEKNDLTRFIAAHHFKEIAPQVWIKTEAPLSSGCLIS